MVQADICKYIILSDTDRKKGDLQYPHPNVVHRHAEEHLRAALGEKTMGELGTALAEVTRVSV